jgi:Icc-related predicted phosphoesterase
MAAALGLALAWSGPASAQAPGGPGSAPAEAPAPGAAPAEAARPAITDDPGWKSFAEGRRAECSGAAGVLPTALPLTVAGVDYVLEGSRIVRKTPLAAPLKVGVISAIKDDREGTMAAVRALLAWMQREKVDLIVANGDLASNEFEMEAVFGLLGAEAGVPVFAMAGNTESCGSFNKVAQKTFATHPSFWNGNWIRRLDLGSMTMFSIPGYFDRRFAHTGGAAKYDATDLRTLHKILEGAPRPWVAVSHGPPKMTGKHGIDIATSAGHVGDDAMADWLSDESVRLGIFGHILEAGGRGTDRKGDKRHREGRWVDELFVNAGTANPDPWPMLDKKTAYGMGLVVELDAAKKRGRFWSKFLERAY